MGLKTEMILIVNTYDCGAGVFTQRHFARIIKVRASICKFFFFFFFFFLLLEIFTYMDFKLNVIQSSFFGKSHH